MERYTVGWLHENTMASKLPGSYVWGEVKELWVEILALNGKGIAEEWSDVCCCGALWLYGIGLLPGWVPLPEAMGGYSARKFTARRDVWKRIFEHHGLEFHKRYLTGGGNYAKLAKVCAALALAGLEMEAVDLAWLRESGICTE